MMVTTGKGQERTAFRGWVALRALKPRGSLREVSEHVSCTEWTLLLGPKCCVAVYTPHVEYFP